MEARRGGRIVHAHLAAELTHDAIQCCPFGRPHVGRRDDAERHLALSQRGQLFL